VIVLGIKEVLHILNVKSTFFLRFAFSPIVLDTREKIMEKKKNVGWGFVFIHQLLNG